MSMERLSHQIDAYVAWKRELMREITRYRGWLERSRLNSPAVEAKLERALRQLRADHITLAFVGEFSRGKTELINSLFFAGYGQRMLPSHAGRTTMCPTELFHDPRAERSYIRLLPIETRLADASVAQFKRVPRHWVNIPLDTGDPEGMAQAFAQVAKTKALPVEQAIQLGFHPDALEAADEPGHVRVPAWRHALVNFDHPLLRQGLRILDTPGLNALGSEPELTLSMLPNAQAILFLLSADAGVTASDMEIWQKYIQPLREDGHSSLFAVLNKIDVLWDDLSGERFVQNAIRLIQDGTARQLGLQRGDVLPLSAKQALLAKVRGEPALLERSRLDRLEALLCERIVAQKEALLENAVLGQVLGLLHNSQHLLRLRLEKVEEQRALLDDKQRDSGQLLFELTAKTKDDHGRHHRRLLNLKTNQRLLRHQGETLREAVRPERHGTAPAEGAAQPQRQPDHGRHQPGDPGVLPRGGARPRQPRARGRHGQPHGRRHLPPAQRGEPALRPRRAAAAGPALPARTVAVEEEGRPVPPAAEDRAHRATPADPALLRHPGAGGGRPAPAPARGGRALGQRRADAADAAHPGKQTVAGNPHAPPQGPGPGDPAGTPAHAGLRRGRYTGELEQQLGEATDILRQLRRPAPLQRQAKVVNLPTSQRA